MILILFLDCDDVYVGVSDLFCNGTGLAGVILGGSTKEKRND